MGILFGLFTGASFYLLVRGYTMHEAGLFGITTGIICGGLFGIRFGRFLAKTSQSPQDANRPTAL